MVLGNNIKIKKFNYVFYFTFIKLQNLKSDKNLNKIDFGTDPLPNQKQNF